MPYATREAVAAFRRTPVLTILSAAMIGLSLFVVGLFGIAAHNVRRALDRVESRVEVVGYLADDAPAERVGAAQRELAAHPDVLEVLYISREQALAIARQELPEFQSLFAGMELNPLPASFEVRLRPGHRSPETVEAVAELVSAYPFVDDVRFGRDWLDKVFLLRRIAGAAALVLGIAFAAVAALIIGAAVRMAIYARRDEISIMKLVGATNGFIRRPFLIEGLMTGLLGAGLALALTYLVYRVLSGTVFRLAWLPDMWIVGGVLAGGVLGIVASAAAVRRYLGEVA